MLAKTEMGYANLIFTSNLRDPLNKITSSPPPLGFSIHFWSRPKVSNCIAALEHKFDLLIKF